MRRALTLCSLLLLPLTGCDPEIALQLAQRGEATATPDPPLVTLDPCATYCEGYRDLCGSEYFAYADYDECETLCAYWDDPEIGENVAAECRSKALADTEALAQGAFDQICADAGPDSATCGSGYVITCERYCDTFADACGSHSSAFESDAKCLKWCDAETLEGPGDTIECRLDSLTSLFLPPSCADASASSDSCR